MVIKKQVVVKKKPTVKKTEFYVVVDSKGKYLNNLLGGKTKEKAIQVWLLWNKLSIFNTSAWTKQDYYKLKRILI